MSTVFVVEQVDRDSLTVRLWVFDYDKLTVMRFCEDLAPRILKGHKLLLSEVPLNNGHGLDTSVETFYGTR